MLFSAIHICMLFVKFALRKVTMFFSGGHRAWNAPLAENGSPTWRIINDASSPIEHLT